MWGIRLRTHMNLISFHKGFHLGAVWKLKLLEIYRPQQSAENVHKKLYPLQTVAITYFGGRESSLIVFICLAFDEWGEKYAVRLPKEIYLEKVGWKKKSRFYFETDFRENEEKRKQDFPQIKRWLFRELRCGASRKRFFASMSTYRNQTVFFFFFFSCAPSRFGPRKKKQQLLDPKNINLHSFVNKSAALDLDKWSRDRSDFGYFSWPTTRREMIQIGVARQTIDLERSEELFLGSTWRNSFIFRCELESSWSIKSSSEKILKLDDSNRDCQLMAWWMSKRI